MVKKNIEFRNEVKFVANFQNYNLFLNYFQDCGFIKAFPSRNVYSLYYDNFLLKCVNDNLSGITPRSKYRFRWYSNEIENFIDIKFERKLRINDRNTKYKYKLRENLNLEKFLILIKSKKLKELIFHNNEIVIIDNLEPKLLVNYKRKYFEMVSGERLTIDEKINFKKFKKSNLFQDKAKFLDRNLIIFELKFSDKSNLIKLIKNLPAGSSRCSKYLFGHSAINYVSYI